MYETILVPTDGSEPALTAGDHAIDLAAAHGATLHVLYVVDVRMSPITADVDRETVLELVAESETEPTREITDRAEAAGVSTVDAVRHGVTHEVIAAYAADENVDLVVMGTHGRSGIEHALLGSITERVLRTADVPVLAVHPDDR